MTARILLLNGPNLNLLGTREPEVYGSESLADVEALVARAAGEFGLDVRAVQSNHEGALIDAIQEAREDCSGIILNPGAFTHTSIALRDALASVPIPAIEVHISNVHAREEFRHHSYISAVAAGLIVGCGVQGYELAVRRLAQLLAG
ncbi:type II 3-dehydroquinate dehydratase [Leucobacter luti]|uniref:type II 3-dehydroquinate dehydratase n=1 Tax=Leucobacter luti TaxID=340320 RepID=UPI003D002883